VGTRTPRIEFSLPGVFPPERGRGGVFLTSLAGRFLDLEKALNSFFLRLDSQGASSYNPTLPAYGAGIHLKQE
jgi:hypothetical protein